MEKKSIVSFQVKKGDNLYSFEIPHGASYGEVYDALFEMLEEVTSLAKQAVEAHTKSKENS
jgi:hypothetical protein